MLKITLHEAPESLSFQVEGKLVGAWAQELESSWRAAGPIREGKAMIVDLRETSFIDEEGKRVLKELFRDGAFFQTAGCLTSSIVDEITGKSRNPWRGILLQALGLFLAIGIARGAEPLKLTLRDAVQLALRQNPQVQIANLNIAESIQNGDIARSALLPQINGNVSDSIHRTNIQTAFGMKINAPGFPFPNHIGPYYIVQAGTNFSTPLFDLTAWRRWQASKINVNAARSEDETVREQNVQLVVSQYLGSLRATADIDAARSRATLAKALFDQAADLQKNGVGTGIDTLRSNVQYQNESQRLIVAETNLKTSLYGLARLLNLDPQQSIELTDASAFFQTADYAADQTLQRAFEQRPELKTLAAQIESQELQRKSAGDQRIPKVSLAGNWAQQGLTPTSVIPVYDVGVNVDVPLFTGGRIKAQTAVADIELKKLRQQAQDVRNMVALEVKTAIAQLESARSEVNVANVAVDLAKEEVTQARDRFQAGVANNIEVVTAQDELSRANDNQISALYRYNQARADLAHATGQMESLYAK